MTPRLRYLLSKTLPGAPLWDVGCDHGLLAECALWQAQHSEVHFVDPLDHQIAAARERIAGHERLQGRASFFHAVKGEQIPIPVLGTLVIAGMGGQTMLSILSTLRERQILRAQRLVLSPHKDVSDFIEAWGANVDFELVEQSQFLERGRARAVLVYQARTSRAEVGS